MKKEAGGERVRAEETRDGRKKRQETGGSGARSARNLHESRVYRRFNRHGRIRATETGGGSTGGRRGANADPVLSS